MATKSKNTWWLLVYRVPSEPASKRVAVWRDFKRTGALYLQQCVCILPQLPALGVEVDRLLARIAGMGGEAMRFEIPKLDPSDEVRILEAFRAQRASEYAEIVEECQTKFVKEIEFERFRENYTFEEAEEIGQDLEKIRRWYDRVRERDWFGGGGRDDVAAWLERCQELLNGFEEEVYRRQGTGEAMRDTDEDPDADATASDAPPRTAPITPLLLGGRKRPSERGSADRAARDSA